MQIGKQVGIAGSDTTHIFMDMQNSPKLMGYHLKKKRLGAL